MDAESIERIERELLSWGVVEAVDGLRVSRRFRGGIARAAAALREAEAAEEPIEGDPLRNVIALALRHHELPPGARVAPEHVTFLVALEFVVLSERPGVWAPSTRSP